MSLNEEDIKNCDNEINEEDVLNKYKYLNFTNTTITAHYDNNKRIRYFINMTSNTNGNNEIIFLHHPTNDYYNKDKLNTVQNINNYHNNNNNNKTTLVNLFSTVIDGFGSVNENNCRYFLNEDTDKNFNMIEKLMKTNNYSRCIIGCGQVLLNEKFNINDKKCSEKFIECYYIILSLLEKYNINIFYNKRLKNGLPNLHELDFNYLNPITINEIRYILDNI